MARLDSSLFDDANARRARETEPKSPAPSPRELQMAASAKATSLLREAADVLTRGMVPVVAFWRPGTFGPVKIAEGWAIDPLYLTSTGQAYHWGGGGRWTDATRRRQARAHKIFGANCIQVSTEITVRPKDEFSNVTLAYSEDGHVQIQYNDYDRLWSPLDEWLNTRLRWILRSK